MKEEEGLTKDDIICEDLGEVTPPVARIMDKLKLSGIAVTQFDYRGRFTAPEKIIMLGSHDNPSFIEFTQGKFNAAEASEDAKTKLEEKAHKLAMDTYTEDDENYCIRALKTDCWQVSIHNVGVLKCPVAGFW